MKRLLFLIIIMVSVVSSAERIGIQINDFSYGLNTVSRGYTGVLGEGTVVHNFDLWKHPKSLTVRDGYDSVFAIPGIDSFLWNGIHAINFVDGTKELAIVGDSVGVGYGNVYVTDDGTIEFGTLDSFWVYPDVSNSALLGSYVPYFPDIFASYLEITADGSTSTALISYPDSITSRSEVVDSTVARINSGSASAYVTAVDLGDTILIVEDATDVETSMKYYYYNNDFKSPLNVLTYSGFSMAKQSNTFVSTNNRIATMFPATGQLWWTQFKGVTYLGTGTGKAISYDGRVVNKFPMKAPGEADIIPLTTSGNLDGNYRYAMVYGSPDDSIADTVKYTTIGYLSTPIRADSQQIMLTDFPLPNQDYYYEDADTVTIEIWRTVGDVGRLDRADSIWYTGISVTMTDSADYANTVVIDTMSDSLIRANGSSIVIADGDFHNWQSGKNDTTIHRYTSKPGSPSIVAWGSANGNLGMWGEGSEVDADADTVEWLNAAGFSYMCVYVDTNLNSPSDSGRSFNFYQGSNLRNDIDLYNGLLSLYNDSTFYNLFTDTVQLGFSRKTTERITLALPRATVGSNRLLLYRGVIIPTKYDTSTIYEYARGIQDDGNFIEDNYYKTSDSFATPFYYLIGEFNPGDTVVDSLCYDSLMVRETYKRNAVPPLIKQMVTVDNQLLATDGQYLYESNPSIDSVAFNVFSKSPINIDDGDEITTLIVQRGAVRLLKNKSTYMLTRNSDGYWRNVQASKNYGSVSAFGHAQAPEGDYVLSNDGVRLEDENIYREKSNVGSLISGQLDNFTNMSLAQQKGCYAKYVDGKYILSFPALDTSYVANKVRLPNGQNRYGWSTWDGVVMCGGDFYAVRKDNIIYPGDTLYFIKSGSNGIYRYGTQTTDNGADIDYMWVSPQLTDLFSGYKQIRNFYIDIESTDTVDNSHIVSFWDERRNTSVSELVTYLPSLDTSYTYMFGMPTAKVNKSWEVILSKNPSVRGYASGGAGASMIFKELYIEMIRRGNLPKR